MKIDIISDIHLTHLRDFGEDFVYGWVPQGEVLIIAGDVGEFHWWQLKGHRLMSVFCERYKHVVWVSGNHDYYGTNFEEGDSCFREIEAGIENFHFLERDVLEIDGIKLAGCALWFKSGELNRHYEGYMDDFRLIRDFRDSVYERNELSVDFLSKLKDIDVVVTHHMPSKLSVNKKYEGDATNRFFLCEVDDLILDLQPKIWVHGHTHIPCDYMLGDTRVICNPKGYPGERKFLNGHYKPVTVEV